MPKFHDPRLTALNEESSLQDTGMRQALLDALDANETARAAYSVGAHIWVEAVLTDRALLIVKGAIRAKVSRVPFPLDIIRAPRGSRQGIRVQTPLGAKTLWGSKVDPDAELLLAHTIKASPDELAGVHPAEDRGEMRDHSPATKPGPALSSEPEGRSGPARSRRSKRRNRAESRRLAGKKPRKPRRQKAKRESAGFKPTPYIQDLANHCIMCGRALKNPESRRHRVGTECIKRHGSGLRLSSCRTSRV